MENNVIGLAGRAGCGKTTVAKMLFDIVKPQSYTNIEFSDSVLSTAQHWIDELDTDKAYDHTYQINLLKNVLAEDSQTIKETSSDDVNAVPGFYLEELISGNLPKDITLEQKTIHRPLLEWIGSTAIKLVAPTVWSDVVIAKILEAKLAGIRLISVAGIRYLADYDAIKSQQGLVLRISRPSNYDDLPTESQINDWNADFDINNEGSLDELRCKLADIWKDIEQRCDY